MTAVVPVQQTTRSGQKLYTALRDSLISLFHCYLKYVCYMHSNNYFVQDVTGDVRWGGGSSRKY